jgi:hypothetical protein
MEGCFIDYCQLSYRSFEAFLLFYKSFEGYEEEIAQNGKMFSGICFLVGPFIGAKTDF